MLIMAVLGWTLAVAFCAAWEHEKKENAPLRAELRARRLVQDKLGVELERKFGSKRASRLGGSLSIAVAEELARQGAEK